MKEIKCQGCTFSFFFFFKDAGDAKILQMYLWKDGVINEADGES